MPDKVSSRLPDVSRETIDRLRLLEELVVKWNPAINLVSKPSLAHLWERHIVDSMPLFEIAGQDSRTWCDFGSGGGFPGLVVASVARELGPQTTVTLVEADSRKCVFLREAARQMDLEVAVLNQRVEDMAPVGARVISARALAPLKKLCDLVAVHAAPGGQYIFPKGARYDEELLDVRRAWSFDLVKHESLTEPSGSILVLRNLHHV
jgi:16S rRNA (guanine527-N7)-methyltransferase